MKYKNKKFTEAPLGTLPILEIDGIKLSGQTAICRHLAWRFGKFFIVVSSHIMFLFYYLCMQISLGKAISLEKVIY